MSKGIPVRSRLALSVFVMLAVACRVVPAFGQDSPPKAWVQDDDRRVSYSGAWVHKWDPRHSGSSIRQSRRQGARASLRFEGTRIRYWAPRGPDGGVARVELDGEVVGRVSLYSSKTESSSVLWTSEDLPAGEHRLSVIATGDKEQAASSARIRLDAFDVTGEVIRPKSKRIIQAGEERVYRKGKWTRRRSSKASNGASWKSSSTKAKVSIDFDGTGIAWVGRKSPDHGLAAVYLDGERVATVGGWQHDAREKRVLWSISGLKDRKHRLTIRPLGRPSFAGKGKSVDVDGFIVRGSALYTSRPTPFDYPWKTYILVDKSDYRLYWVKDKTLVKAYPIAHGRKWTYTPHRVWRIDAKYKPDPKGVYGPRKMRLFKRVSTRHGYRYVFTAYGIHGTNQPWVIGTMASHGCIRMYNRDVLELFPKVPLHTMVVTRG